MAKLTGVAALRAVLNAVRRIKEIQKKEAEQDEEEMRQEIAAARKQKTNGAA
jgi:hypothetical protein